MFCTKRGHELGNGDEFCTKCGAPIKREEPDKADIFSAPQKAATKEGEHSSAKQTGAPRLVKCPHCGENIPSFSAFCPSCGQELRFPNQISSIADLSKRIADIESLRQKRKGDIISVSAFRPPNMMLRSHPLSATTRFPIREKTSSSLQSWLTHPFAQKS